MNLDNHGAFVVLFSGVCFFMYGMTLASEALQKLTANKARDILSRLSDKKLMSMGLGVGLTILLQSSGAVTSMLVGLGTAGVITLPEVMGLIIGSAIGSTFTVQMISFKVAKLGLGIFSLFFILRFVANKEYHRWIANVGMGFGLIFFGLDMMGAGANVFKEIPAFMELFKLLNSSPITTIIVTAIFTAFVHSSAVTIGFAMTLGASGVITMLDAMYWIFGANIGTTGTALVAALGGNFVGRQVAWANTFFKVGCVVILFAFAPLFVSAVEFFGGDLGRQMANAHTIFNLVGALIFYPFITRGANLIVKMFPPNESEKEFGHKYLEEDSLETPTLAIAKASREIGRMGDIVVSMLNDVITVFDVDDPDLVESIRARDNQVDILQHQIKAYLIKLGGEEGLDRKVIRMISFVSDLESAADTIEKGVLELAIKASNLKVNFSEEGKREILLIHSKVMKLMELSIPCFVMNDLVLANKVVEAKREIRKDEAKFRKTHYQRLNEGKKESVNTSALHLDTLSELRRISSLMTHHAYGVIRQYSNNI